MKFLDSLLQKFLAAIGRAAKDVRAPYEDFAAEFSLWEQASDDALEGFEKELAQL